MSAVGLIFDSDVDIVSFMRTRLSLRLAIAALAVAVLAGCGSATGSSGSAGSSADAGPPQSGGTLRVIKQTEPSTLDPAKFQVMVHNDALIASALFGELLVVKDDGHVDFSLAEEPDHLRRRQRRGL